MKILIAGAGAVGTLIGAKLALAGKSVIVFHPKESFCETINKQGLTITEQGQTRRAAVKAYSTPGKLFQAEGAVSLAVMAVKSYATRDLVKTFSPHLHLIEHLLTVQNGLGNEEILLEFVKPAQLIAGSLTIACSTRAPGSVAAGDKGGLALASLSPPPPAQMAALFKRAGFQVSVISNWQAMKWSKALLNMIGNATSALLDMTVSEVFSNRELFRLERQALLEAIRVMQARGISPVALPGYPVPLYVWAIKRFSERLLFSIFKRKASRGRGEKLASFHQDFVQGKTQTESEFLYGAMARRGQEKGIKTPVLSKLNELLTGAASGTIPRETFRRQPDALLRACWRAES